MMKRCLKSVIAVVMAVGLILSVAASALAETENTTYDAKFYLLLDGLPVPTGTSSQPKKNYKLAGDGKINQSTPWYNDGKSVDSAIVEQPEVSGLEDGQTVLWYVIKKENDGIHVDGVVVPFGSVLYNGNGADTGKTVDNNRYKKDSEVTVMSNGFFRRGYTFSGWNTKADASGQWFDAGDKAKMFEDSFGEAVNVRTLYAIWEKDSENDDDNVDVKVVTPKKMSIRLEDGRVLKSGDSFTLPIGKEIKFQMCSNNWDNDAYDENGNGIAGTVVYTFKVADSYTQRGYDEASHTFTAPKGDPVLRTDTNNYFMAYRYYFKGGNYNKQTGIKQVVNTPTESLSVNLPLGSTITSDAYRAFEYIKSANVFVERNSDKTISYNDYYWAD